jgi:hypothetical protein
MIGAILFTDVAVAANLTALFFFMAEAFWLAYLWLSMRVGSRGPGLSVLRPAAALALAGALFIPVGISDAHISVGALHSGILNTIEPHPLWWPLRAMQAMTGNAAFWPMLLLSVFAVWNAGSRHGVAIRFILCWLLVPFAILELISWLITPMMVERYVLASLVAWLALTAIGLAMLPNQLLRYSVAALVVAQSLAHVHHHWRAPEDVQWREAAQFAVQAAPKDRKIAVMPPWEPMLVMRYYLPPSQRDRLVSADATLEQKSRIWMLRCGPEPVLVDSSELPPETLVQVAQCYPRMLKHFRLVDVRSR